MSRRRARVDDGRLRHRLRREDLAAELPRRPRKTFGYPSEGQRRRSPARPAATSGTAAPRPASATAATASGSTNGKTPDGPAARRTVKALEGHFDPQFRGYDLDYPDVKRADRFIAELAAVREGGRDAAAVRSCGCPTTTPPAPRVGKPTPTADGRRQRPGARAWSSRRSARASSGRRRRSSSIEDDAQNGPDHVDAHRTVALVDPPVHQAEVRRFDDVLDVAACCGRWS